MGIGKSKITPSIDVDEMFRTAETSHEIETEKQDADKLLVEIREAKEALSKIRQDLQKAINSEHFAQLQQLIDKAIESWEKALENHRAEQTRLITEHESNMRKILRRNEGVWYSDFWMKVLVIFVFVYSVVLGLITYCAT